MENTLKKIDFWYFFIHSKLKECSTDGLISYAEARMLLFHWRIPNYARAIVLKELEIMGLVEKKNRRTLKVNNVDFPIEDTSKLYEMVGLFPDDK
jgi:hypothetical protein